MRIERRQEPTDLPSIWIGVAFTALIALFVVVVLLTLEW
jgi:hypothetical protein